MSDRLVTRELILYAIPALAEVCERINDANQIAEQIATEGSTDHGNHADIAACAVFFGGQITRHHCQWWETGAICHEGSHISSNSAGGLAWTHKGRAQSIVSRRDVSKHDIWPFYITREECSRILLQVWSERRKIIIAPNRYIANRWTVFRDMVPAEVPSMMQVIFRQWQENERQEEGISQCQYRRMIIGQ